MTFVAGGYGLLLTMAAGGFVFANVVVLFAGAFTFGADKAPGPELLAGWMHVLTPAFLDRFAGRVLNLHPALPGQFAGTRAIERAFEAYGRGEITESGCMVHLVVPEVDAGPVIAQAVVPFEAGDSVEQYEGRMHAAEHRLIVEAVQKVIGQ